MKKFRCDMRGAVTIIVSMMLIPALLLSGTAVDLARIHAAKSAAQNANQLAANTVLSQYDALLKDLYGLFGVAEYDPILAGMINDYIQVAILGQKPGDDWIETGLGTFQMFEGSTVSAEVAPAGDYHLGNRDVLRRQIEEYMKFRGPVILVEQLLKSFETHGSSVKSSYEAIEQQEIVGDLMVEFVGMYVDLYDAIVAADRCREIYGNPNLFAGIGRITRSLRIIKETFIALEKVYEDWIKVCEEIETVTEQLESERENDPQDTELIAELQENLSALQSQKASLESSYDEKREHIEVLAVGGNPVGIEKMIENVKADAIEFKKNFQKVVDIATSIDGKREEIRKEIADLQQKINDPDCDPTLKEEMKAIIDECSELLNQFPNIEKLAKTYQTAGNNYIDKEFIPMLEKIKYRDDKNESKGTLSISELGEIATNSSFGLKEDPRAADSKVALYGGFAEVGYSVPEGFKKFAAFGGDHKSLYDHLDEMAKKSNDFEPESIDGLEDKSGAKDAGKRQRNIIQQLKKLAEDAKDKLTNDPLGAEKIVDSTVSNPAARSFNMNNGVIDMLNDPAGAIQDMADYALVLTYATGMFSNYTTGKPAELNGSEGVKKTPLVEAVTGIPMSPKVNYFYQSEWEYLLIGNKDADKNLKAVSDLIYTIRVVCNMIAVFTIPEVKQTANTIKEVVTLAIPYVGSALGVVLYFATFTAFAAAESVIDLADLRGGCKVPLIKNKSNWICRPEGIVNRMKTFGKDGDISVESADEHGKEKGITYEQYMLSFFIVDAMVYGKSIDTLVERMGNLIEWNVVNYDAKANAKNMDDKGNVKTAQAITAMSTALAEEECFRLSKMRTDFDVTTVIDLRLMFLTMPMFQKQGSPFTNEYQVTETDYRGY